MNHQPKSSPYFPENSDFEEVENTPMLPSTTVIESKTTHPLSTVVIATENPQPELPPAEGRHSLWYRKVAIANMIALGMSQSKTAEKLGISPSRISILLTDPEVKALIKKRQNELYATDPTVLFKQMAPAAAKTLRRIAMSSAEKGSARVSAATAILDRAYGKPKQEVSHDAGNIMDLFRALDEMKGANSADTPSEKTIEGHWKPLDESISEAQWSEMGIEGDKE